MHALQAPFADLKAALPEAGLFADKEWVLSPEPFALGEALVEDLEKLGYRLLLFVRACNELYHLSVAGKAPGWIADWLDRGKPKDLVEFSRSRSFRQDIPLVIRPDLVLTSDGFTIAEVDSVPGGIGLTAWLNRTYAQYGFDVIGGADGMIEGFKAIAPGADILVSEEAATYRPEMEWLAQFTGQRVCKAESYQPKARVAGQAPQWLYRFFEHFDLPNIPSSKAIQKSVLAGDCRITPPFKPYLEEKLWFGLFWLRPLRDFWRRELGDRHYQALKKHIPYSWLLDPAPLPLHAVIPELGIHEWNELETFTQKQRELLLKVSGFSELAWGSRGVTLGSDVPLAEWREAVREALQSASTQPSVLQRFHRSRVVEHPGYRADGSLFTMQARVRLCPYYFVIDGRIQWRGALATVCPADKKLLHGMKDAIIVPAHASHEVRTSE